VTSSERDHRTRWRHFPIGGQWWLCVYLARIRSYEASEILGHEFDLLGSRDVIGPVIIGLSICGFLLVVHCNHASILHRYIDMRPQRYWGHDFDLLGSPRDHRTRHEHFSVGGQWWPCFYLARIRRYGASNILVSWVWPFEVTWRHRSRDHWTRHMRFSIGGPL